MGRKTSDTAEEIGVEVVFARPDRQLLVRLSVPRKTTAGAAIAMSGIAECFPEDSIDSLQIGVWGHPVGREHVLQEDDRVEIYRPLRIDPRKARRLLAQSGKTMGSGSDQASG